MVVSSSSEVVVVDILSFFGSGTCGGGDGDFTVSVSGFSIFSEVRRVCRLDTPSKVSFSGAEKFVA